MSEESKKFRNRTFRWKYTNWGGMLWRWWWEVWVPEDLYKRFREEKTHEVYSEEDYVKFIVQKEDEEFFKGLIKQMRREGERVGYNLIETAEWMLNMVHFIPYTQDTEPEYPRYPIETLVDGAADCECASILVAKMWWTMGLDVALLLLPDENHAAVGVCLDDYEFVPRWDGIGHIGFFEYQGRRYWYAEAAGSRLEPPESYIGYISPSFSAARAIVLPVKEYEKRFYPVREKKEKGQERTSESPHRSDLKLISSATEELQRIINEFLAAVRNQEDRHQVLENIQETEKEIEQLLQELKERLSNLEEDEKRLAEKRVTHWEWEQQEDHLEVSVQLRVETDPQIIAVSKSTGGRYGPRIPMGKLGVALRSGGGDSSRFGEVFEGGEAIFVRGGELGFSVIAMNERVLDLQVWMYHWVPGISQNEEDKAVVNLKVEAALTEPVQFLQRVGEEQDVKRFESRVLQTQEELAFLVGCLVRDGLRGESSLRIWSLREEEVVNRFTEMVSPELERWGLGIVEVRFWRTFPHQLEDLALELKHGEERLWFYVVHSGRLPWKGESDDDLLRHALGVYRAQEKPYGEGFLRVIRDFPEEREGMNAWLMSEGFPLAARFVREVHESEATITEKELAFQMLRAVIQDPVLVMSSWVDRGKGEIRDLPSGAKAGRWP